MKINLVFPPQWTPLSPHCAPTVLNAELKKEGYECKVFDLNIDFYESILTPYNMQKLLNTLIIQKGELDSYIRKNGHLNMSPDKMSDEFKLKLKKQTAIKNFEKVPSKELYEIIASLPEAISVFKDPERFYNLEDYQSALFSLDFCLNLISLAYYPWELTLHDYMNPYFKFTLEGIKKEVEDNIYKEYLEKTAPNLLANEPDAIGISISSSSEFIASLTLAKILKQKTKIPVLFGGNYISRLVDTLVVTPEFFDEFSPYVIYEEGERALVDFMRYLEGKIKIEQVPSLIYKLPKNKKVKLNKKDNLVKLNDTAVQNLDDYVLKKYFLPEIVLPIQASRGCYWRKCTFCDHDFGQTYNVKNIEKLTDEIAQIQSKYGISHFEFVDEAISAQYLKTFSQAVIDKKLNINWYCNCRLESNLTYDIFKLARKAGLRMILWGYESGSEKIMEMINKGVDTKRRLEILKAANDADIWNFAYIFFGFPTETKKDADDTKNAICNNIDIIPAYGRSVFTLGKHALMRTNPEKYGITDLRMDVEPFSSNCSYKITDGLRGKELDEYMKNFTLEAIQAYDYPAWMSIRYRETLFLYICKYSMEKVKKMKSPFVEKFSENAKGNGCT